MHRIFVPFPLVEKNLSLTESLAHRLLRVLRLGLGDKVILFDPNGAEWVAEITTILDETVKLRLVERIFVQSEHPISLHLFQAIPKGEKMDFIVQKATELGVKRIVPIITQRTVVRFDKAKAESKQQRWVRIAQASAEQCGACYIPEVATPQTFKEAINSAKTADLWLMFHEKANERPRNVSEKANNAQSIAVMVGPEGGFEEDEVKTAQEYGAYIVGLGKRILRAETASVVAVTIVLCELGLLG